MGILNRLWSKVWNDEEIKKYRLMHDEIYAFTELAKERARENTEIQKACLSHGGPEHMMGGDPSISQQNNSIIWRNAALQNAAQSHLIHGASQRQLSGANSFIGTNVMATNQQINTVPPWGMGIIGGISGQSHAHTAGPVYWSWFATCFYQALRGIEEAAMNRPEGNHRYDDLAIGIQDMRYFDPQEVSLIGLASFCLSNLMEVEPIVMLLEGNGIKVV